MSQEAWAGALKALPALRQPERFAPWLYTIARRSVLDHLRQKYRPLDALASDAEFPSDVAEDDEVDAVLDRAQLAQSLAVLPPGEREVLVLFYLQDLALEECAQILEIPVGTVKSRLSRARRLLRGHRIEKGLPARTQLAFAAMILVGLAWGGLAAWTVTRRPLFALDRVIAAWLSVTFSTLMTIGTVAVALTRGSTTGVVVAGIVGPFLIAAACLLLIRARSYRTRLVTRRRELECSKPSITAVSKEST